MKDLTGMKFGHLLVIKEAERYISPKGYKKRRWLCKCDCGKEKIIEQGSLISGHSKSCGCYKRENIKIKKEDTLYFNYPEIFYLLDKEKNKNEGIDIYNLSKKSDKKVWWKCNEGHLYQQSVKDKVSKKLKCPICSNKKVLTGYNDLYTLRQDLIEELDWDKNNISPKEVMPSANIDAYWLCKNGHSYKTKIKQRHYDDSGCPYCYNKVLYGYNDIWTLRPDLRKYFLNEEDAKNNMLYSSNIIKVICPFCKDIKDIKISNLSIYGFCCRKCGINFSYPEKFLYNVLRFLNVENIITQKTFDWSLNKKYDFYIPSLSCIIEANGLQHYQDIEGWNVKSEEQQENDKLKEQLAKENGIKHYIVLDCRKSEMEWIKNSILNSKLNELFDLSNINWQECEKFSNYKTINTTCDLYKNGKSIEEISEIIGKCKGTVLNYLKKGKVIGIL